MLDPARLVFIDETAVTTKMVRLYGRSPRGVELIGRAPFGKWQTITFVAALRHNKMAAPMVIDGAMNAATFLAYIEQCLVPTLRRGDIVVLDNLGSYRNDNIRRAIEKVEEKVEIVAYLSDETTPSQLELAQQAVDLNPKESDHWLRRALPVARTLNSSADVAACLINLAYGLGCLGRPAEGAPIGRTGFEPVAFTVKE